MNQTIDIEEIKKKLYENLKPSGWHRVLRMFIFSSDFDNILLQLIKQTRDGKRFTPKVKQLFRAFEECPYTDLKVIIIGQDPYPQLGVARMKKNLHYNICLMQLIILYIKSMSQQMLI